MLEFDNKIKSLNEGVKELDEFLDENKNNKFDFLSKQQLRKKKEIRTRISSDCRSAIQPEINKIRKNLKLPFICPITHETINDLSEIHIDHCDLTFVEVIDKWLDDKDLDLILKHLNQDKGKFWELSEIEYLHYRMKSIFDLYSKEDFIKFHNEHTHLIPVSKKANLSILRKLENWSNKYTIKK